MIIRNLGNQMGNKKQILKPWELKLFRLVHDLFWFKILDFLTSKLPIPMKNRNLVIRKPCEFEFPVFKENKSTAQYFGI